MIKKKTLVSWYTLHTKCIVNSSTSVLTRKGNKKQINNEYCYEFVDRLKRLELKNLLYWFLFPQTKNIFENYKTASFYHYYCCERFEPRSHFKSRLSLIVRVNVVLNRIVVESDWRFENLCSSHLQSQSELYHVSWWYFTLVIDLIGQLRRDVIGRLSVKPWCYWLSRLVINQSIFIYTRNRIILHGLPRNRV